MQFIWLHKTTYNSTITAAYSIHNITALDNNKLTRFYFSPTLHYFVTFSIAALELNTSKNGWDLKVCAIAQKIL